MYRDFYQLRERPFELNPVEQSIYLSETHQEAISLLKYGILADKGFLLLTGGVGTGKTTIINTVLSGINQNIKICLINNPSLTRDEFFQYLSKELGFVGIKNKIDFLGSFKKLLNEIKAEGGRVLLIIDEAQVLSVELFEEIRLLSNQEQGGGCLGIFFIGQPELQEKLSNPRLLPLRQRIGLKYHLEPLSDDDVWQYITFRIQRAGGVHSAIFDKSAVEYIGKVSKGNPRLINIICDQALITGYTQELQSIDIKVIKDALKDVCFPEETGLQVSEEDQTSSGGNITAWLLLSGAVFLSGLFFYALYKSGKLQPLFNLLNSYLQ